MARIIEQASVDVCDCCGKVFNIERSITFLDKYVDMTESYFFCDKCFSVLKTLIRSTQIGVITMHKDV